MTPPTSATTDDHDTINAPTAAYVRRSTFKQENEHQMDAIRDWLADHDLNISDIEVYSETASGATRNRDELCALMNSIENGELDHVVIWELSRIARDGELAQQFFNLCEDNNVHVHVTSGSIREIRPDGTNRFVADILAAVYAEERRSLIRRTKFGIRRAKNNEKWIGQPPLGFTTTDDGYLVARLDDDLEAERDSFYAVRDALQDIDDGASYRSVAKRLHASRHGVTRLYKDDEKRRWYLHFDAEDDRVQRALNELTDVDKEVS